MSTRPAGTPSSARMLGIWRQTGFRGCLGCCAEPGAKVENTLSGEKVAWLSGESGVAQRAGRELLMDLLCLEPSVHCSTASPPAQAQSPWRPWAVPSHTPPPPHPALWVPKV